MFSVFAFAPMGAEVTKEGAQTDRTDACKSLAAFGVNDTFNFMTPLRMCTHSTCRRL